MAKNVDPRLARIRGFGLEDIDPNMVIDQKRIPGPQHEKRCMHVENAFVERDGAEPIDIAQDNDEELHQHHQKRQPTNNAAHRAVDGIEMLGKAVHAAPATVFDGLHGIAGPRPTPWSFMANSITVLRPLFGPAR